MKPMRLLLSLVLVIASSAQADQAPREINKLYSLAEPALVGADGRSTYIVQLASDSASVQMRQARRAQGAQKIGDAPYRVSSAMPAVKAAADRAGAQQQQILGKIGVSAIHSYRYAFNGFAARMTAAQAAALREQPEVAAVWEDKIRPLATNYSPTFLGLFDNDDGLIGAHNLDGSGVVIGIIDSGIAPDHPSFADTRVANSPRACQSSWGENSLLGSWLCSRYKHLPPVSLFDAPENWAGECISGDSFEPGQCNNKLIGARFYLEGAEASGELDSNELRSVIDVDGHGTHIASTAAGNRVDAVLSGSRVGRIRGMAPGARIAAYKACWLRPGATRATCNISDLARAIDDAVADGVDIINYSIGNTDATIANADDLALLNATNAGVLTVVAAGNNGPVLRTIGSPASSPWVLTVGASSRDGLQFIEASEVISPPAIAGRYATLEAAFTPTLQDNGSQQASLIAADDDSTQDDSGGDLGSKTDACQTLINDSQISGKIAFIQRGSCDFDVKISNAQAAGAIAAVVFNNAGAPITMLGDGSDITIPAVMIGQADGQLILDRINAGESVTLLLAHGLFAEQASVANIMGSFSSRGPSAGAADILKPDVVAPGINVLAAMTEDVVNGVRGQSFAYLTGTSMAAPHVSGSAALLKQAHPQWTPMMLRSALMTSARQDIKQSDAVTDAHPFDMGAGHIAPNKAHAPGLVYDTTSVDFESYACGNPELPADAARCEELAAAGHSFDPSDLNQPAIAIDELTLSQRVTRTVTQVGDTATWTAALTLPAGFSGTVTPSTLSLSEGESASFTLDLSASGEALNFWYFGALEWVSGEQRVRSPIALKPVAISAPDEISAAGGSGTLAFDVRFGYTGAYTPNVFGLKAATLTPGFVDNDPSKSVSLRDGNGVKAYTLNVPADQLYLRLALFNQFTDGNDDLDLYLYYCPAADACREVETSGNEFSDEQIDVIAPAAGEYLVLVHGFATDQQSGGEGANFELFTWQLGPLDRQGNLTVDAPSFVSAGSSESLTANWQGLDSGQRYLGIIIHDTPNGSAGFTLVSITN